MKKIPLTRGKVAIIDDADYERVVQHQWHYLPAGSNLEYAYTSVVEGWRRKTVYLHRFILNAPSNMTVDHIDGDGLNNRRHNLRLCSQGQNLRNRKVRKDSYGGYKSIKKARKKWRARITADGMAHNLGTFDTPEEAAQAYNEAAIKYHGEFARLKEIPGL